MKVKLLFALALVLLVLALSPLFRSSRASINWHSDQAEAFDQAATQNLPVLVFLYTDWCSYCRQMDGTTFQDPEVVSQMANEYVWLRLNAEKDPEGVQLQRRFFVSGFPTLLILDSAGREIDRLQGYVPPNDFPQAIKARIPS